MPLGKIELINFLHSIGIEDVSEAMRLKSLNISDITILAHYKITKKQYQRWAHEYHSIAGKSVSIRKRGKLVAMKCTECNGIVRFDSKHDRICDECGLIVDSVTQAAERVRFALRELNSPIRTQHQKEKIKNLLTVGRSEEDVIRIMLS
jgi:hypothetical protein